MLTGSIVRFTSFPLTSATLGNYMAKVFENKKAPGDRVFGPVERLVYRVTGVSQDSEQRWTTYAISLLIFSMVSALVLYGMQRLQAHLPLNPDHLSSVSAPLSFNTAVSFLTNTNWQSYAGEATMSHFTQMPGLAVQNFVSAARASPSPPPRPGHPRAQGHQPGQFLGGPHPDHRVRPPAHGRDRGDPPDARVPSRTCTPPT